MAFVIHKMSVLAYAPSTDFTLWHYKAGKDLLETVVTENYFSDFADSMTIGDMIMISAADGTRIMCVAPADVETVLLAPLA